MSEAEECPRICNTGAQNTLPVGLYSVVDWVSGTFKYAKSLNEIFSILCLSGEDFKERHGQMGYKKMLVMGHIKILYDGSAGMGYHVEITGQGCREYELYSKLSWKELFARMIDYNVKFTRIDIAIDDFDGYFTLKQVIRKCRQGLCRSKFKKSKMLESIKLDDGSSGGLTCYFGSDKSRIKIRMYEKIFEQIAKGKEILEGVKIWNRTEIECRDERANILAILIIENANNIGLVCKGILSNYVNFLDRIKGDSNKGRYPVSNWWVKFLDNVEPLRLTVKAPDASIERSQFWVDRQIEPTLAKLFLAYKSDMNFLLDAINNGLERLTDKDLAIIEQHYRNQENDLEVSKKEIANIYGLLELERQKKYPQKEDK